MKSGKRFVFLEGAAGTAKTSICSTLAARGHRVHFESFVELCDMHPVYEPGKFIMSFKWANEMITRMEEFSRTSHDVVFFDRSLFTPYVFARASRERLAFYLDLHAEVSSVYDCDVVLLHTDREVVKQRLLARYESSSEEEKMIRQSLNELNDDFVERIDSRYEDLYEQGAFSLKFDTSYGSIDAVTDRLLETIRKD